MAKVLCVLYDDPVDGYPTAYARDDIPKIDAYPDGQTTPSPRRSTSRPGELLGSVSGELGPAQVPRGRRPQAGRHLRQGRPGLGLRARAARRRGRHLAAVLARLPDRRADRQGAEPEAGDHRRHRLRPRRPAGGDRARHHRRRGDLLQQHQRLRARGDDDPRRSCATTSRRTSGSSRAAGTSPTASSRSYDLEGMQVGTVAAGRIGSAVLRRLKPFDVGLHYTDRHRLPDEVEQELGVTFHADAESMVPRLRRGHDQRAAAPRDRAPVRRRS